MKWIYVCVDFQKINMGKKHIFWQLFRVYDNIIMKFGDYVCIWLTLKPCVSYSTAVTQGKSVSHTKRHRCKKQTALWRAGCRIFKSKPQLNK